MNTNQALADQRKSGDGQKPTNMQRRALLAGAVAALLASSGRALADDGNSGAVHNPFILLLRGLYEAIPAGKGPNLGLTSVDLSDGTYSKTKIYPVFQVPGG